MIETYYETKKLLTKKRENKIRSRAYQIFLETGNTNDKENWTQAESEIRAKELTKVREQYIKYYD